MIAAARAADAKALIVAICDERLRFLQSLKTWGVFGKGWGARVAEVKAFSLALAARAAIGLSTDVVAPQAANGAAQRAGKGVVPTPKGAQQGSAATIAAAGAAAATQAHQSGASAGTIAAIVVAGVAAAIAAYAFWHWRQQRQQDKPV